MTDLDQRDDEAASEYLERLGSARQEAQAEAAAARRELVQARCDRLLTRAGVVDEESAERGVRLLMAELGVDFVGGQEIDEDRIRAEIASLREDLPALFTGTQIKNGTGHSGSSTLAGSRLPFKLVAAGSAN